MSLPKIYREDNCLYLYQEISSMDIYEKSKAIVNFCDKETKLFEKEIDRVLLDIFERNGINIPNTNKSVLKLAFDTLKGKNKDIDIVDLYKPSGVVDEDSYKIITRTKNGFTIMLERNYISGCVVETIQCGVEIKEKELWNTLERKTEYIINEN